MMVKRWMILPEKLLAVLVVVVIVVLQAMMLTRIHSIMGLMLATMP